MENKGPLVSFLIALYNKEKYVQECVDSCLNQTYQNIEVCIVDDGSTDKSFNIVKKLYSDNSRVKIYSFEKNQGKVSAYNKAYEMSSGDFYALVGADDVNLENRIEILLTRIIETKSNLSYGNLIKTDENLNKIGIFDGISFNKSIQRILRNNFISGGASLFDKHIAESVFPINREIIFEDWWISLIAILNYKVSFDTRPVALYRLNESNDNLVSNDDLKNVIKNNERLYSRDFIIYKKLLNLLESNRTHKDLKIIEQYISVNYIYKKNYLEKSFIRRIKNLIKIKGFNVDRWYLELLLITLFGSQFDYYKKLLKSKL